MNRAKQQKKSFVDANSVAENLGGGGGGGGGGSGGAGAPPLQIAMDIHSMKLFNNLLKIPY